MSETSQLYLGLETESGETATEFQGVLNQLRESATSTYLIGNEFERLMKQYLSIDPLYKERFTDVYLWKEWAALHTEYDGVDTGIDLVARESRRRILRDSVQMLCRGHAGFKATNRLIHIRFSKRIVHESESSSIRVLS